MLFLPETLYLQKSATKVNQQSKTYLNLLLFQHTHLTDRHIRATDCLKPFFMLRYISITLPALYHMTCFGYGTVLLANTGASLFARLYHFDVAQTGLLLSIPLLIGSLIGKFNAGWLIDWMVYRHARRHDGHRKPEARLDVIWFALLIPAGIIVEVSALRIMR